MNETLITADINMLNSILRNLISNAIKFTNENGLIEIGIVNQDFKHSKLNTDFIEIFVRDNGIGMTKEIIDKLFRIDENVTSIGTNGEKGTGLGLILCKEFTEKHNGKIRVESEVGKGSIFYVSFPILN
jgi:signal transduction histidine kinase